jgi:hypothetical protein
VINFSFSERTIRAEAASVLSHSVIPACSTEPEWKESRCFAFNVKVMARCGPSLAPKGEAQALFSLKVVIFLCSPGFHCLFPVCSWEQPDNDGKDPFALFWRTGNGVGKLTRSPICHLAVLCTRKWFRFNPALTSHVPQHNLRVVGHC